MKSVRHWRGVWPMACAPAIWRRGRAMTNLPSAAWHERHRGGNLRGANPGAISVADVHHARRRHVRGNWEFWHRRAGNRHEQHGPAGAGRSSSISGETIGPESRCPCRRPIVRTGTLAARDWAAIRTCGLAGRQEGLPLSPDGHLSARVGIPNKKGTAVARR